MAKPTLTVTVSPTHGAPGATVTVTYAATDPDVGRTASGDDVDAAGQPYHWQNTYSDTITANTPTAPGMTFTQTNPLAWTGKVPASGAGVTITGSVSDVTGNVTTDTAALTIDQPTPTPAPSGDAFRWGMSAPKDQWDTRLSEVGGPSVIKARRIFVNAFDGSLSLVSQAMAAKMLPVVSFKCGAYSWADVGAGKADAALKALVTRLDAIPGRKHLVVHHEPHGDGTPADFVAMQLRALPILKTAKDATVGPILNGWWWSSTNQGLDPTQIEGWVPKLVRDRSDWIGADCYQGAAGGESGGVKIRNLIAWAKARGVGGVVIGEFNAHDTAAITDACNAVKSDPIVKVACVYNSTVEVAVALSGDRLAAFKKAATY